MTQGMMTLSITTLGISRLSIEVKVVSSVTFLNFFAECRSVAYLTTAVIYECKKVYKIDGEVSMIHLPRKFQAFFSFFLLFTLSKVIYG